MLNLSAMRKYAISILADPDRFHLNTLLTKEISHNYNASLQLAGAPLLIRANLLISYNRSLSPYL
jgi:hypothetical protein